MFRTEAILACILGILFAIPARAQANPTPLNGSELTVYLITFGPGDAPWEKWGHDCIRVVDHRDGFDASYNYGMFDFGAPGFIGNFMQGRMTYWVEAWQTMPMLQDYISHQRTVWMQELNMTDAQKLRLFAFLENNCLAQNKHYKYDYYRDNCTSRVRDAIDYALGAQIKPQLEIIPTEHTYRRDTRIGMASPLYLYLGLNLSLGHPADRKLSAWGACYLPMQLHDYLNRVTVLDSSGKPVPLVMRDELLNDTARPPLGDTPPNYAPGFVIVGIGLAAMMYLVRRVRWAFVLLAMLWSLLCGLAGVVLVFFWFTDHEAAYWNENAFQFTPLSLLLMLLLPIALYKHRLTKPAMRLSTAIAAIALLGFVAKVLPMLRQPNWDFVLLAVPMHLSLLLSLGARGVIKPIPANRPV